MSDTKGKASGASRGRPAYSDRTMVRQNFTLRMPRELRSAAGKAARKAGYSLSGWICELMRLAIGGRE